MQSSRDRCDFAPDNNKEFFGNRISGYKFDSVMRGEGPGSSEADSYDVSLTRKRL